MDDQTFEELCVYELRSKLNFDLYRALHICGYQNVIDAYRRQPRRIPLQSYVAIYHQDIAEKIISMAPFLGLED